MLAGASVAFVALAIAAHFVPWFAFDPPVARSLQSVHVPGLDVLMRTLSAIGFRPETPVVVLVALAGLFAVGLRREAIAGLLAGCYLLPGAVVRDLVARPRPAVDLVHVSSRLASGGFPSGHALGALAICGYFVFLVHERVRGRALRIALTTILILFIALMGWSRIYEGQHWPSDVIGGYLLGGIWLALTIRIYRGLVHRACSHVSEPVIRRAAARKAVNH
jgi:undecaprenyl-diphosphatase